MVTELKHINSLLVITFLLFLFLFNYFFCEQYAQGLEEFNDLPNFMLIYVHFTGNIHISSVAAFNWLCFFVGRLRVSTYYLRVGNDRLALTKLYILCLIMAGYRVLN